VEPTIGRIVHYVSYGTPGGEYEPLHRAAAVTAVYDDTTDVGLCVINPTGIFFHESVSHDSSLSPGTWHWPEMVAADS